MIRGGITVPRRIGARIATGDRWVLARIAARDSAVLDRVLPTVGRAANYGRLWLAIGAGMALTGNRRARRAALRGLVALSGASAVTNLVSKRVARRPRPLTDGIPLVRRLLRTPITTSFPSGHSASAAAFATAVALEAPALVAPVAVLAAMVAVSRMVTGVHYPSDVLVGLSIGAGTGLLTLWWWPREPPGPTAAGLQEPVPASVTGSGIVVVVNVTAGGAGNGVVDTLSRELPDAEIVTVEPDDDLADVVAGAADRATVLGVAGGDGTVNLAARHAAERDIPLLVVPAGTLNHFALAIGVESVADAIAAVRTGSAGRVDLGRVGDEVFLNTFSIGLYADLVRFRHRWERRVGKWPALLIGLAHTLRRCQPHDVDVAGERRRLWLLFAGNGRYRPTGFAPAYRPSLTDGRLDVRMVDGKARWARTRIVLAALTRTLRWTRLYETRAPAELRISVPGDLARMSVDGEVRCAPDDLVVRVDRRALLVYRPDRT